MQLSYNPGFDWTTATKPHARSTARLPTTGSTD